MYKVLGIPIYKYIEKHLFSVKYVSCIMLSKNKHIAYKNHNLSYPSTDLTLKFAQNLSNYFIIWGILIQLFLL